MKKKSMILAVASLGSMAIIGTGFAGWVISADATAEASGVMVAYDVVDQRLNAETGAWGEYEDDNQANGKFVFGAPKTLDESIKDPWLTCDGMDTEILTNTYTFKVSSKDDSFKSGQFKVVLAENGFTVTKNEADVWARVKAKKLVVDEPEVSFESNGIYSLENGSATIKMKVTFAWGDAFKLEGSQTAENPYNYYNKLVTKDGIASGEKDDIVKAAHENITTLDAIDAAKFKFKLIISPITQSKQ